MNNAEYTILRLKRTMLGDKERLPKGLNSLIRADIMEVLGSYFDCVSAPEVSVEVDINGEYVIKIIQKADGIKNTVFIPN